MRFFRLFIASILWEIVPVLGQRKCSNKPREVTSGKGCVFPSRRKSAEPITECVYSKDGTNQEPYWWCPTTDDYCLDKKYMVCPRTKMTYGGTDPGKKCHLPFTFDGKRYTHCTKVGTETSQQYYWCATSREYSKERWTRCEIKATKVFPCKFTSGGSGFEKQCLYYEGDWKCLTESGYKKICEDTDKTEGGNDPGKPCHFPFYYRGELKRFCQKDTNGDDSYEWCSTTGNFDKDGLWTRCKKYTSFKLEGILLVVVIVGGVLAGAILLACFIHYICDPLHYLARRGLHKEDESSDEEQELRRSHHNGNDVTSTECQRLTPSAPPERSPPSYDDVVHGGGGGGGGGSGSGGGSVPLLVLCKVDSNGLAPLPVPVSSVIPPGTLLPGTGQSDSINTYTPANKHPVPHNGIQQMTKEKDFQSEDNMC